jgi:hypothetical protein
VRRVPGAMRNLLRNLSIALAAVVFPFVVLEGAARLHRRWQDPTYGGLALYSEHDPLLGWRKKAGATATFTTPEYKTEVHINRHGLRDKEREYDVAPGTLRILALGDSFVEGYTVALEQTVTQALERSLTGRGRAAEVLNGGTTAYSTDQEYLFYQSEGRRYSPRIVLLFFYYNDVLYNARAGYRRPKLDKPVFLVEDGHLLLRNVPVPATDHAARSAPDAMESDEGPSVFMAWLRNRVRMGAPALYSRVAATGVWPPVEAEDVPAELKIYKRKRLEATQDAWMRTELILSELATKVEADGARLLVVYVPSAMEVSDRAWALTCLQYGADDVHWDRRAVWDRLQGIADRRFALLDLTPPLREADHGVLGGPYFPRDGHWNAVGHEVAARAVEATLRQRGWLP